MKKIIMSFIVGMMFFGNSFAKPVDKGTIEIGGNFNTSFVSDFIKSDPKRSTDITTKTANININIVKYVATNFGLGLIFGYNILTTENNWQKTNQTDIIFGPIMKYNLPVSDTSNLKFSSTLAYITTRELLNNKQASGYFTIPKTTSTSGLMTGVGVAVSTHITDSVNIDVGVKYQVIPAQDRSTIDFVMGLTVYIK